MKTLAPETVAAKAGRPRRPETEEAILLSALQLFGELGYEGMTVEATAARAGVGKATLYRRWSSKDDLIISAVEWMFTSQEISETGNLRNDLVGLVGGACRFMSTSTAGSVFPRMASEVARRTPLGICYVQKVIGPRRKTIRKILSGAMKRGELRPELDVELLADILVGPIVLRRILGELGRSSEKMAPDLVDSLLDGWRPRIG